MNRGAEELQKVVTEHGSKTALARKAGLEPYELSRILNGERRPQFEQRAWFEDNLHIGWRLWDVVVSKSKIAKPTKPSRAAQKRIEVDELRNRFSKRPTLTAKPIRKTGPARKSAVNGAA